MACASCVAMKPRSLAGQDVWAEEQEGEETAAVCETGR